VRRLRAHPDTPCEAVRHIAARADWVEPDSLQFKYVLEADLRRLRIPPSVPSAGRTDELWAHTCFEAFIRPTGAPWYLELNFSPSGQWAAYRFAAYRQGMVPATLDEPPRLTVRRSAERLELQAQVRSGATLLVTGAAVVNGAPGDSGVRIAVSAVVEDHEGRLSYWALRHPAGKPDFHHPESFALALEPPRIPRP
jgi:hypothetical protein